MEQMVSESLVSNRFNSALFGSFALIALLLAAFGIYGVMSFVVAQRTQEIGVRIALGAGVRDVVRLVLGEGVRIAVIGIVIGGGVALWASKWIGPLLFSVSPKDPTVYGVVAVVLLAVAILASAIPATRASRVDPNVALRSE
jgi:ABC-type antimicrobial peptide transport system permease subunit